MLKVNNAKHRVVSVKFTSEEYQRLKDAREQIIEKKNLPVSMHYLIKNSVLSRFDRPEKIEVVDTIVDWEFELVEDNVVKYVAQAKEGNNKIGNLKKARWYLDCLIKRIEK
tara:strand:- start:305 stop:637 length:333 start_codon:yes stop_codon:yes gene_type:complete